MRMQPFLSFVMIEKKKKKKVIVDEYRKEQLKITSNYNNVHIN